jgi:two-component system response regulator HydG
LRLFLAVLRYHQLTLLAPGKCKMGSRKRLLFVDDEPSIRLTLPPILQESGFEVKTAATVPEALVQIHDSRFDVLVSDLNIGEAGDGFRIVQAMRQYHPHCITVVLTGYPGVESAAQALRYEVDDFVVKPADIDSLVAGIYQKLASRDGE